MIMVGQIYYKFVNNELIKIRVIKKPNNGKKHFTCMLLDRNTGIKLTEEKIKEDYILLKPNGYLTISSVILENNLHDVIVGFHKMSEVENGDNLPYACCRQSVIDVYANLTNMRANEYHYVGVGIDKDSCPEDVDYRMLVACNSVDRSEVVCYYIEDDIKELLSWTKLSYYNGVLDYMYKIADKEHYRGFYPTVYSLLDANQFLYNIYRGFNIQPLPLQIIEADDKDQVYNANPMIPLVENIVKRHISAVQLIKYGYDVDLNKIERDHLLVADTEGRIYVLLYDEGTEYYNPGYAAINDKREYKTLEAILAAKSKS